MEAAEIAGITPALKTDRPRADRGKRRGVLHIASLRAVAGILQGFCPMLFPAYIRPKASGETDARHDREYTAREIQALLGNSGFDVTLLETGPFRDEPKPEHAWVEHLLDRYMLIRERRSDGIYAVGRKTGVVQERYPGWLYS